MREIKFRAWHPIIKEMYHNILVGGFKETTGLLPKYTDGNFECWVNLDGTEIIMQSTGLFDKNGKEIYEGDIIIPVNMHDSNIDYWDMEYFKDGSSKAHGKPLEIKWLDYMCGFDVPSEIFDWEIIGNIYENSELLEKDKI